MSERVPLTLRALAQACEGELHADDDICDMPLTHVVIDDREARPGSLFVAVRGERFDGHDYIARAAAAGAAAAVSDRPLQENIPYVLVHDTVSALQAAARLHHDFFAPRTVAVTGSAGKTTTKEMICSVLSQVWDTNATKGNLNNQTGVPLTLFGIGPATQAAVVEMGMNHAGEISRVAYAANPDVGVITNIGTAHIEYLGSREGILAAKTELLAHVKEDGRILLNGDDELLRTVSDPRAVFFGLGEQCDVRAEDIRERGLEGVDFRLVWTGGSVDVSVPAPGRHMVYNALAAAACGLCMGMDPSDIVRGIAAYTPAGSRMRVTDGILTVIDDTYNANAPAMKAALDVLSAAEGRRVAVLGEMRELGSRARELHREVLEYALSLPIDTVAAVGAAYDAAAAIGGGRVAYFESQEELFSVLEDLVHPQDTVLVKGSRGMHMEKTVEYLKKLENRLQKHE